MGPIGHQIQAMSKSAVESLNDPWSCSLLKDLVLKSLGCQHVISRLHINVGIPDFAAFFRLAFVTLGIAERKPDEPTVFFGATGSELPDSDVNMEKFDPWANYNKTDVSRPRNCRWEDLTLPDSHCFQDKAGKRIAQVHRHQLNANVSGVAFCTKASLNDVMSHKPRAPFALLLPANDRFKIDKGWGLNVSSPIETIVHDPESKNMYKRQVVIAQLSDDVTFKLPEPVYQATLTVHKELVIEVNAQLSSPDLISAIREKPIEVFKQKLQDQYSPQIAHSLQLYGVRIIWSKAQKSVIEAIQVICKTPESNRSQLLERSGIQDLFVRDFLTKDQVVSDTTILPKFWGISKPGRDEALRSASSLTGFAGLTLVRRGIAVRGWASKIVELRKVLMAGDDRFNEENSMVIPRFMMLSSGWPLSTNASDVTKAVTAACKQPPIPMRCARSMGLNTWTLGFQEVPAVRTFTALFNNEKHEILLTDINASNGNRSKPPRIAKPAKSSEVTATTDDSVNERLTTLESKMSSVERRQDTIEQKLDGGFSDMQDQLRRVLQAVQGPRSASPSKTGFTPPPKVQKQT